MIISPKGNPLIDILPDVNAAFIATMLGDRVCDGRYENNGDVKVVYRSPQQATANEIKKENPTAVSVTNCVKDMCCLPYLRFDGEGSNLHLNTKFEDFPIPDWSLWNNYSDLLADWRSGRKWYPIMTTTGCMAGCKYCSARRTGHFKRDIDDCVEEIRNMKDKGINYFQIVDDCWNTDVNYAIRMCDALESLKLHRIAATNGLRADNASRELLQNMWSAGFRDISFGVESVEPEVLSACEKGETFEQIDAAVQTAKEIGFAVHCYFIIGLPKSTYESDMRGVEWAKKSGVRATFSYAVPYTKDGVENYFFGDTAKIFSTEYPAEQQKRVYDTAQNLRTNVFRRVLKQVAVKTGLYRFVR